MANTRKTIVTYEGDGTQTIYSFSFDYLSRAFVKARLISSTGVTELVYGVDYTVTGREVTFTTAPTGTFQIYRETPTDQIVTWEDASVLRAGDLTTFEVQLLHIAEETDDKVQDGGMAKDPLDGKWDARLISLKNLLDPIDPQDAVTKAYVESVKVGIFQARDTAVTKATEATNSATNAATSATNAANSAANAANSASTATTKATEAANSASQAATSAANASNSATTAITKANEAATSATNAAGYASTATTEANRAKAEADRAKSEADRAESIANVDASTVKVTPTGNITATDAQNALIELDTKKVNVSNVVTTPAPNKILKLDGNGKLPASITGNAATATKFADGKDSSSFAHAPIVSINPPSGGVDGDIWFQY